ncbi:hypothetical protein [Mycolicibacterium goodii]|uniref:Uncharacterized protein n=1 Tax=Mycolicibacterium goodii TaxID=134601 RepID=A0ABS6HTI5_MYCGD|nr:hypothetical protein [Mycolicibacterium goodii]OKH74792.1 hypothetical protein EB74_03720 [Mycobacterium sp. SWH-M5]MBU8810761.1 hypothetical protein [Mycolicibacterium goodii]MBU8817764.1 hypothetical protein [Mycolicibacterium goodii]MBU8825009.1 hypothetical protein [Mycolicibacterium goodii]MBU8834228.1 hypothetical protein [Mycolicibacterium goodii]
MKKFGVATGISAAVASGLAAVVLGLAAPASADVSHHYWVNNIGPQVTVPHVDTTVHQSR